MLRGMVFVDHMNFDISLRHYYQSLGKQVPKLDYNSVFRGITSKIENVDYIKTYLFIPKPDDFLRRDKSIQSYYEWASKLRNGSYIDTVEGNYFARPTSDTVGMDISDKSTYYKVEKGTDVNLALYALSRGFYNAYDVAFIVSGDTDYLKVYEMLKNMGKLVVVVGVQGQNMSKIRPYVDNSIILDDAFLSKYTR